MVFDPISDPRVIAIGESGCWLWTGATDQKGYGRVLKGGRKAPRHVRVHRLQVEATIGRALSQDECVCHRCDEKSCVNPAHLFVGSSADNVRDRVSKQRSARGESINNAKLTDAQVREIFLSAELHREIAARFGVRRECIGNIKRGRTWRHVTQHLAS